MQTDPQIVAHDAPSSQYKSPLDRLWRHHPQVVADALSDSAPTVERAKALRAVLDRVARGDLSIDAPELRMVIARLGLADAVAVADHRRWEGKQ